MAEKGGAAAAVAAVTTKAKLAGLWREKIAQTDPSGENAPRYIISDRPMTEEEWIESGVGNERPYCRLCRVISCVHLRSFSLRIPIFGCSHRRHAWHQLLNIERVS